MLASQPATRRWLGSFARLLVFASLCSLLLFPAPAGSRGGLPGRAQAASIESQDLSEQATFEMVRPEAQWSPRASEVWQTVSTRQVVTTGDRVRTGPGAAARLVYFEGTAIELGESTGLLVVRLERTTEGNIITNLFQSAGTTLSRVVRLLDPAAQFEIETPAAIAIVRGTTPRVQVASDGTTRVANVPDETGGLVLVQAKDPAATLVTLAPGEETEVQPAQPPLPPVPIGQLSAPPPTPAGAPTVVPPPTPPPGPPPGTGRGGIEGVVRDATTGRPLAGITITAPSANQSVTTDSSGRYQLTGLPPGPVQVTATASGYIGDRATVSVPTSGMATQVFALSQALAEGQLRIVLTWGNTPRDLDSHLWTPAARGTAEVYFGSRGSLTGAPFAALDVDDTSGLGPETITIGQLAPGRYTYAVHQFSSDGSLAQSGARVQVLRGSGVLHTFQVPSGAGRWWTVFTLDGASGAITPVDRLGDTAPVR